MPPRPFTTAGRWCRGPPRPSASFASIDHSMWWYRDIDINQWHLYVQDTPTAAHGRGLGQAKVYTQDGELVACMTQEAMIRVPEEDLKK